MENPEKSTPESIAYQKGYDDRSKEVLDIIHQRDEELVSEILKMIPVKAPAGRKGYYPIGFYKGAKFVNSTITYLICKRFKKTPFVEEAYRQAMAEFPHIKIIK